MKTTSHFGCLRLLTASMLLAVSGTSLAANAEPQEIDDNLRATIQKEKAKKGNHGPGPSAGPANRDRECGNINIANEEPKRGSRAIAYRQKTVIVTGNVINTPCK